MKDALKYTVFGLILSALFFCALEKCHAQQSTVGGGGGSISSLGTLVTSSQDLSAVIAAGTANQTFLLSAGTYNLTNCVRMKLGQSIIGRSWSNTFIKFWGYSSNSTQPVGDDWVALMVNTNTRIADLDIRCMVSNLNCFQAAIGRSSNTLGANNFIVDRVSMHGDTDNFYWDNGGQSFGYFNNCLFEGNWDTFAATSMATGSGFYLNNCRFFLHGPSICRPSEYATAIRMNGSHAFPVIITGGQIDTDIIGTVVCGNLSMFGTVVAYGGTNFNVASDGVTVKTYGVPNLLYSKAFSNLGVTPTKASVYFFDSDPQSFTETSVLIESRTGGTYFNTNTGGTRYYNGVNWDTLGMSYVTNQYVVSGASDSAYNGVYTWKRNFPDSFINQTFTNAGGKFLMLATNVLADYVAAGLSATESMNNGTEFAGSGAVLNHGWDAPESAIRVVRQSQFTGNGAGLTNIPASAVTGGGGSGGTNSGPITLSLSGTNVAVSCTCPNGVSTNSVLPYRFTCTTNFLLQNPAGMNDGQTIRIEFLQDATGSRLLFFDTKWAFGTDITATPTLTTTAAKRDFLTATYNSTADKWYVVGFTRGY